jgi:hypothetical protein
MQPQRATGDRTRCQRHGLVVNNDGACSLCVADRHPSARGRLVRVTLLMAVVAAAVVMAIRWQLGRFHTDAQSVQDQASAALPEGRVRLARSIATQVTVDPHETVAVDHLEGAEDHHLGKPLLQPRTLLGVAPPAPPRASVDPEPQAPEDPRDFELPSHGPSAGQAVRPGEP